MAPNSPPEKGAHMQMVIDGDGHLAEPTTLWQDYVDPQLRDRIHVKTDEQGNQVLNIGGFKMPLHLVERSAEATGYEPGSRLYSVGDTLNPNGLDRGMPRRRPYSQAHPGGFDPTERLKVHDAEGIDA